MDLTRLAKLLELTTSNYDGEAPVAIRPSRSARSNEALKQFGLSWTELLVERSLSPQDVSDTAPP